MPLRLKLFGGLSLLDSSNNATRVTRRHRLAVLAVLASADRPVSRERLLALIWPDSNEESARHALGQVLYGLRQDVALGELVTGAADLSLNRSHIECDLWSFREALKTGDKRKAIAQYTGPFLDGVQLPNADAFDRWCEEERRALARTAADTIEGLATDATTRGDFSEAMQWWRQLAETDPLSSRVALSYMRALVANGDRAAALQHARVHGALVRAELEVDAEASVLAYAEELRASPVTPNVARKPEATQPSRAIVSDPNREVPSEPQPVPESAVTTTSAPPNPIAAEPIARGISVGAKPARTRTRWNVALMICAFVAVASAALWLLRDKTQPTEATASVPVVAVLPFDVTGDSTRAFLGEALSALLSSRLDAPGVLRTLESNAVLSAIGRSSSVRENRSTVNRKVQALGATLVVAGTVVVLGNHLEINAELRGNDEPESRTVRASVAGAADSLFALADKLGAALLVAREGRALGTSALGGTSSVPALKALLAGEQALRNWQLFDAIAAYKSALAIDSTYAFAWYRLGFAEGWAGVTSKPEVRVNAVRYAAGLPERYALLLKSTIKRGANDPSAESDLLTLVQRYPDDADAWSDLGEFRMHVGPLFGKATSNAEAPLARALALDSLGHPEVRWHLSQLLFERGDEARARATIEPLLLNPKSDDRVTRGVRISLSLLGTGPIDAAVVRQFRENSANNLSLTLVIPVSSVGATDKARALAESLATNASSPQHQAQALAMLMQIDAARQHWTTIANNASRLALLDSVAAAEAWGVLAQLADVPFEHNVLKHAGDLLEGFSERDTSARHWQSLRTSTLLAIRAFDNNAYVRRVAALEKMPRASSRDSSNLHTLRALHAQVAGDTTAETLELHDMNGAAEWQLTRWVRAAWLERIGRYDEAEQWYLSAPWGPFAVIFTRPALERASALERRRGNARNAEIFNTRALRYAGSGGR